MSRRRSGNQSALEMNPPEKIALAHDSEAKAAPLTFVDRVHLVIFDDEGPRPFWRVLLYLGMTALLYIALDAVLYNLSFGRLWFDLVAELGALACVLLPATIIARLEHRPFGAYGLPRARAFGKLFWLGAIWGLAALSVLMLMLRASGAYTFDGFSIHGLRIAKFAAYWGVFFLAVAFFEEFLVRGYTQFTLAKSLGFWPAAVLLSVAFAAIHLRNPQESWVGVLAAGCIGFFLCLTLRRTGNLWFAVGFHATWDWAESFLYSVPDSGGVAPGRLLRSSFHGPAWLSGGSVGPEGSALVFVLLAGLWVVFGRVYREVNFGKADGA